MARGFLVGIGVVLGGAMIALVTTNEWRGEFWGNLILILILGLSASFIWLGLLGPNQWVVSVVCDLIEATPEEFAEHESSSQSTRETVWEVVRELAVFLPVYAVVYGLALVGSEFIFSEGRIWWGAAMYAGGIVIVLIFRRLRHRGGTGPREGPLT